MDLKILNTGILEEIINTYGIDKSETGVYLIEKLIEEVEAVKENTYNKGYKDGYDYGYNDGYNSVYDDDYNSIYDDGYDDDYDRAYDDGYEDGYKDAYDEG